MYKHGPQHFRTYFKTFPSISAFQFFQCQIDNANAIFEFQFANAEVRAKMRAAAERIAEMADRLRSRLCAVFFLSKTIC